MIWNDLIDLAFIDLAVIQPGASISAAMKTDAQSRLNMLISALNTEGRTVFNQVTQTFNLVAGTSIYTLGSGGTLATTGGLRANKVLAWHADSTNMQDGGPVLSLSEVAAESAKFSGDLRPIPRVLGADTAYPLTNIRIAPAPSAAPGTLTLEYTTPIAQIADFTLTITLPDGWPELLHWSLAVELYPQYARPGQSLDVIASQAQNAKARIVDQNTMGGAAPQPQQG